MADVKPIVNNNQFSLYDTATGAAGVLAGTISSAAGVTGACVQAGLGAAVTHGPAIAIEAGEKLAWAAGATAGAVCTYGPPAGYFIGECLCTVVCVGAGVAGGALTGLSEALKPRK